MIITLTLSIICAVLLVAFLFFLFMKALHRADVYEFKDFHKTDVPYITLEVQGIPLNLLVDTGCGISILQAGVAEMLSHEKSLREVDLEALTSDSLSAEVISVPITLGKQTITEDFALYDKDNFANFQSHYGITLHGLLGTEFFEKTGCCIDYSRHALII